MCTWYELTHWGRDKMATVSQTTLSNAIFLNENVRISIEISLKFVPEGPINNISALVQIMAWRRWGNKPLSKPMMIRLPTHICVTRSQWFTFCCEHTKQKQHKEIFVASVSRLFLYPRVFTKHRKTCAITLHRYISISICHSLCSMKYPVLLAIIIRCISFRKLSSEQYVVPLIVLFWFINIPTTKGQYQTDMIHL